MAQSWLAFWSGGTRPKLRSALAYVGFIAGTTVGFLGTAQAQERCEDPFQLGKLSGAATAPQIARRASWLGRPVAWTTRGIQRITKGRFGSK
jgi:hypothetical protein